MHALRDETLEKIEEFQKNRDLLALILGGLAELIISQLGYPIAGIPAVSTTIMSREVLNKLAKNLGRNSWRFYFMK